MCKTSDIGVNDYLFGGNLLAALDEAGAIYAYKMSKNTKMVTLKVGETIFKKPVKVKDIVAIFGKVIKVGSSSMTIKLAATSRNVSTGDKTLVCDLEMVFVRIDENGKPVSLPKEVIEKYS